MQHWYLDWSVNLLNTKDHFKAVLSYLHVQSCSFQVLCVVAIPSSVVTLYSSVPDCKTVVIQWLSHTVCALYWIFQESDVLNCWSYTPFLSEPRDKKIFLNFQDCFAHSCFKSWFLIPASCAYCFLSEDVQDVFCWWEVCCHVNWGWKWVKLNASKEGINCVFLNSVVS